MLRLIFPLIIFLVYLPMAQATVVDFFQTDTPCSLQGFNALESNKEIAYQIECTLESVGARVESAFKQGEIAQQKWEHFKQLHFETESFVRLFIMANLYYEEAPVEHYGHLVELFSIDMLHRLILLDRFCIEIGIEAIPPETV